MTAPDQCFINAKKLLSIRRRPHMTQTGHRPVRNPAAQQTAAKRAILLVPGTGGAERHRSIQNDSGLAQGLAGWLWQVERAASRVGGDDASDWGGSPHVGHEAARVHHAARRR